MELPRRLLMGSSVVTLMALVIALIVGSWRAEDEVNEEMQAAMDLALVLQQAQRLGGPHALVDDQAAVDSLRTSLGERKLRHLELSLRDESGQRLWALRQPDPPTGLLRLAVDLHRRWQTQRDPAPLYLPIERPSGAEWSLVVSPSPDSERRQALTVILRLLTVLALGSALLLLVMGLQIRRLMRPMAYLLDSLAQLRAGRSTSALVPPRLALAELQAVADALQALELALQGAERGRQLLAQRMLTLQEDERRHVAQELHDELGQRLTALRLDASVLQRRLREQGDEANAEFVATLSLQVQHAQQEVRELVHRLAPRTDETQPTARLLDLLHTLTQSRAGAEIRLTTDLRAAHWPSALALALYRMSQEAITNALRHAHARRIELRVEQCDDAVIWSCSDDGTGIVDVAQAFSQGNGLAGMRQRAWAFGGDLELIPCPVGLTLRARLQCSAVAVPYSASLHNEST